MPLIYVTGASGTGKSTVLAELRGRGYAAYGSDEDGLARWFQNSTGDEVSLPTNPSARNDRWFAENTYRLPPETVRRIGVEVGDGVGFICGTVGNEDEIWDLFAAVVNLTVDPATLRHRLTTRGGFGSTEEELAKILTWQATADHDNAQYGALLLNAAAPAPEVTDTLLNALQLRAG